VTSGENTDNQEAGAADRPELFQEADGAEAREVLAERRAACAGAGLDRVARNFAGLESVFEREDERGARGAGGGMRGVPRADSGDVFGEGERCGVFVLPRWADASRHAKEFAWLRDLPRGASWAREHYCGQERELRDVPR
jgi:hypothetical protein